ncbi:MAG: sulfotransferase [Planctomycetaceae bacterium]|nr:sulfotransferase [Planctomycetaceae bacterium]
MADGKRIKLPHLLYFSTLSNWLRVLARYGRHIAPSHWFQAICITLFTLITVPIRGFESLRFGRAVRRHKLSAPPVFIVGHWRSGTTNAHNHFLQDPQFASVTLLHCAVPNGFLTCEKLARKIVSRRLPKSRPMDAVPLGIDEPMSEDFALAGMTHMSHYLNYFFPKIAERTFRETVLFEGSSDFDREHWGTWYDFLLKKVSFASGGRRLLLKNPPNVGRIQEVLRRYPDAKFIHVYRNPWLVHASTMKLMDRFVQQMAFHPCTKEDIEQFVSIRYQLIMEQWMKDRSLIPAENLIEIRHEDMTSDPMPLIENVYRKFDLPGWDDLRPRMQAYVDSLQGYVNNEYKFDDGYLERVSPYLTPFADAHGYKAP